MSVKLDDQVVEAIKSHYGPYYCNSDPVGCCMYGPGPIPYYLQSVYSCPMGREGNIHTHNREKSIHIAKNWLYYLDSHLREAKENNSNALCASLVYYQSENSYPTTFNIMKREGNSFIYHNDKCESNEYLGGKCRISLTMRYNISYGKGFKVGNNRIYVNGNLVRTNIFSIFSNKYVTKQSYDSERTLSLEFLAKYEEPIREIRLEMDGELDTLSDLFPLDLLEDRIRPFYSILKFEATRYFLNYITLEECITNLRKKYLALPEYKEGLSETK